MRPFTRSEGIVSHIMLTEGIHGTLDKRHGICDGVPQDKHGCCNNFLVGQYLAHLCRVSASTGPLQAIQNEMDHIPLGTHTPSVYGNIKFGL